MGIYRGAGGTGDAVNDASSEATLVQSLVSGATTQANNAATSATAAQAASTQAAISQGLAADSATAAATSATNAANSASTASTQATNAATSATAAQTAETAAELAETNAETAETNAETAASQAATSATNASNSASAASTSATNASNSATAAATSATNASNSASAASTSASNASTSATAAASSASAASTSASNASTSATNAANSATAASTSATTATTQAGIATTQASNASTSASNAATSATNASNSASAAATSATNASNSASAAATSETNAAASFDSFDDRYLGAKSSAPTLDNDGNTLLVGALYFNSADSAMKVWNGTAWLDAYASLSGALIATNNLADLNNTSTARSNLGVAIGTDVQAYDADLTTLGAGGSSARSFLGLAIGTDVQAYDAQLADIAGLTPTDNSFIVGNGTNFVAEAASTARTSLGVTATGADTTYSFRANNLSDLASASTARTNLGLAIGTNVQAWDGDLDAIAAIAGTTGLLRKTAANTWSLDTTGYTTNTGTVTGVTGTSPVSSSGGTTPAISLSANYGDTQNPYASKTAKFVLAAPNAANGLPTFRALVASDVPTLNQNTTGTASNVTGIVDIANGGTGATTRQNAMDALAGSVTSGQYLRGNGSDVLMSAIQAADVPTLNQNTTGSAATVTGNATGSTFGFNSGYGSVETAYGCRAWVNFNGTGTVAIRGSAGVTNITDGGVGIYTVNLSITLPDTNYSRVASAGTGAATGAYSTGMGSITTTSFGLSTVATGGSNAAQDVAYVMAAVFR
jgi:hypothetical protein